MRDTAIAGYKNLTERNCGILTKAVPRLRHNIYLQSRQVREASIYISYYSNYSNYTLNKFLAKIWHTIKPGTPEHETPAEQRDTPEQWRNNGTPRNTSRTPAEHLGIPTEQQCNANETPQNNETAQNEEIL